MPADTNKEAAVQWGVAVILDGYDDWWLLMPDKGYTSKVEMMEGNKLKVRGFWLYPAQVPTPDDIADRVYVKKERDTVSVYSVIYEGIALQPLGGGKFLMGSSSVVDVNAAFRWVQDQEAKVAASHEEHPPSTTEVLPEATEEIIEVSEEPEHITEESTAIANIPNEVEVARSTDVAEVEDDDPIPDPHTLLVVRDRRGEVVPAYWDGSSLTPLAVSTTQGDVALWTLGRKRRRFTLGPNSGIEVLEVVGPCEPATHIENVDVQLCVKGETLVNTWIRPGHPLMLPSKLISDWLRPTDGPIVPFRSKEWLDQRVAESLAAEEEVLSCLI